MVNIFREIEKKRNQLIHLAGKKSFEETTAVSEYILARFALVSDGVEAADVDALGYLEMLYFRVVEDRKIIPELRSLMHILRKMEEDLIYSVEMFGKRAEYVLDFLEADTLRQATEKSRNEREEQVLGRILRMRMQYFSEEPAEKKKTGKLRPVEIKAGLDEYVIGQEDAKIAISTAVYGHLKRVENPGKRFAPDVVLLIGPSGCGKTEIMRRIRDITDYPMIFTDVSNLGASQYRGRHKEDILLELYEEAGKKKAAAERGIIFMDEFDKLLLPAISERGVNIHDDVQSQLLTMLEGSEVELKYDGQPLLLDTSHMFFVLAGAFQGLEEYIRADKKEKSRNPGGIGFFSTLDKEMDLDFVRRNINHEVLMKYGMKRELAGRISYIAVLNKLSLEDMLRILTEPKDNLISRYERELQISCDAELIFTEGALRAVANEAMKTSIGARALQSILGKIMRPILFHAPDRKGLRRVIIHEETVLYGAEPMYEIAEDAKIVRQSTLLQAGGSDSEL
ncbi:MAG: AAA family ATPase [Lachnospiraceae bacterium]|nr:AAA family ATPase [Lachnospiraceae bacterium]